MSCELRPATVADTDAVYGLICELKQKAYDRQTFAAGFAANLSNPNQCYQLAVTNGEIVGLLGLQIMFPLNLNCWIGEIQELVILPQVRGLNIGKKLLAWAEDTARERGASLMELSSGKVRTDAHRFYLREGYLESHFRFKKTL
ncbi:aminoalkylphosphonate N-acetyltransferase [Enterobacteriaceae bacterium RIT691]|nr:aminoalkylphosphonate N-acetyltransferase [Enterobacteriaceae bacterium RIT691]